MANPSKLSAKVTLECGKELDITFDVLEDGWNSVKEHAPGFYPLFRSWAKEGEATNWEFDNDSGC